MSSAIIISEGGPEGYVYELKAEVNIAEEIQMGLAA